MRITQTLPSFDNVAAGSTATQRCPVGLTYDKITIAYSGVTRAQLQNIEVVIGSKTVQTFKDGDRLQALNSFYGRPDDAGYLTLFFARPEMHDLQSQRVTALGTADVQTLTVKIDIDAAAAAPVLTSTATLSDAQPLGLVNKVKEYSLSSSVAGQILINELALGPRIQAIHFIKSDVTNIQIDANSRRVFEGDKSLIETLQKEAGRVPQTATMTTADWMLEGDVAQAFISDPRLIQDLRIRPTLGTAGALDLAVEYLDQWSGI